MDEREPPVCAGERHGRAGGEAGVDWERRAVGCGGRVGLERARGPPCGGLACLGRAPSPRIGARAIGGVAVRPRFGRIPPARWPRSEGAGLWVTRVGTVAARRDWVSRCGVIPSGPERRRINCKINDFHSFR